MYLNSPLSEVNTRQTNKTGRPIGVSILVCDIDAGYHNDKTECLPAGMHNDNIGAITKCINSGRQTQQICKLLYYRCNIIIYEGESKIIRNVATYCAVGYTAGWA
jgi:hypothetical protein